ncbi:DHHC-type zinc finger family protein putative isoform 1 [Tripterygium wilfordii]|uniref:S-acyltransferase n=2 Tax=Tripterygium wilfordii TaxID=458696 RepID=A0A7J7DW34_TRIWF|nr:probable protein S-acyltransferase 4 isoform X1 [Tripterygium wilfordii]KAF5750336.1 DHHC-type zinc finger family protein putative isoform 1 [Tripterygium wilfordii]
MAQDKPMRLYQAWKGSNRFFCGGRLIFGPDAASLFLTLLLIAVPAMVFCIKIYCKIHDKLTRHPGSWYPVLFVGAALTVMDLIFLLLTSGRDPGIVPRNVKPPETDEAWEVTTPSMEWVNGRTPHMKLPRMKDVIVNGHSIKVKYCDTCLLYRPPRASHCSICNNCVQRFDHHCPWVGQCIGIRNYRLFFMFISTATILCIYVFVFSWINILEKEKSIWKAMSHDVLSDLLIVYCFVAVWFVGGLTFFHFYLVCKNQTTYENFRYRYDKKLNPYTKGLMRNIGQAFFSKIPPSMNNFRSFVEEDEHKAVGSFTPNYGEAIVSSKEKIDIELAHNLADNSAYSLPEILRNLDYDDEEDDLKTKQDESKPAFGPLFWTEQDMLESGQVCIIADEVTESVQSTTAGDGGRESSQILNSEDGARASVQSSTSSEEIKPVEETRDNWSSHQTTTPAPQV